jgi:hypothetical protein
MTQMLEGVDVAVAAASIDHLRHYIKLLLQPATRKRKETS